MHMHTYSLHININLHIYAYFRNYMFIAIHLILMHSHSILSSLPHSSFFFFILPLVRILALHNIEHIYSSAQSYNISKTVDVIYNSKAVL